MHSHSGLIKTRSELARTKIECDRKIYIVYMACYRYFVVHQALLYTCRDQESLHFICMFKRFNIFRLWGLESVNDPKYQMQLPVAYGGNWRCLSEVISLLLASLLVVRVEC